MQVDRHGVRPADVDHVGRLRRAQRAGAASKRAVARGRRDRCATSASRTAQPTRAARRRGAAEEPAARRRLRHRVGPPPAARARRATVITEGPTPARRHAGRPIRRSSAPTGSTTCTALEDPPAGDLRPEPPQPPRHGADDPLGPRRRGARKLVVAAAADYFFDKRWKATISALALNAIPIDREITGRKSSRHDPRADRRRLQPGDLSRGRSLARRLGPGLQGRRGVPVGAHRRTGRPGVHRRHRRDLRQGHEAAEARPHEGRVRQPAVARSRTRAPVASAPGSRPRSRCSATSR